MAQSPDHMSGINALPTKFVYDPKNYDREAYSRFKEARAAADKARVEKSQRDFAKVMKDVSKVVSDKRNEEIANEIQPGDVLIAERESTCFSHLQWEATEEMDDDGEIAGIVTGTFAGTKGAGRGTY